MRKIFKKYIEIYERQSDISGNLIYYVEWKNV